MKMITKYEMPDVVRKTKLVVVQAEQVIRLVDLAVSAIKMLHRKGLAKTDDLSFVAESMGKLKAAVEMGVLDLVEADGGENASSDKV
jgi:hypothetical protein